MNGSYIAFLRQQYNDMQQHKLRFADDERRNNESNNRKNGPNNHMNGMNNHMNGMNNKNNHMNGMNGMNNKNAPNHQKGGRNDDLYRKVANLRETFENRQRRCNREYLNDVNNTCIAIDVAYKNERNERQRFELDILKENMRRLLRNIWNECK
jgi:phosphoacetylglucosamine mutase